MMACLCVSLMQSNEQVVAVSLVQMIQTQQPPQPSYVAAAGTKAPPKVPIHWFVEPVNGNFCLIHFRCVRRYDREAILRAAPGKLKSKTFKGNSIFISDDIDLATHAQHQQLVPILREMRSKKHFAFIPWSVPHVIRYNESPKESDLPLKTYRLKNTN